MIKLYVQMAVASIKRAKWRSLLTMLGVIIGVSSVVMIFSLGEGIKRQVSGELKDLGTDTVVIRSGTIVQRNNDGQVEKINLRDVFTQSVLTEKDVEEVKKVDGVDMAAPVAYVSAPVTTDDQTTIGPKGVIVATTPQLIQILNREVETGEFFTSNDTNKNIVVLGAESAKSLFGEELAVGRVVRIKNTEFIVRGVMARVKPSPLDLVNTDYNHAVYMPFGAGKNLNDGTLGVREIDVRVKDTSTASDVVKRLDKTMLTLHGNIRDFSVLEARDFVGVLGQIFGLLTTFVTAVAGISLLVGGIGIMNIMLVSVSERTREIGIRKSIGATNQQILGQFLVEAVILTLLGGIIGVMLSLLGSALLRYYTTIRPFMDYRVIAVALGVTFVIGLVFGIVPALKAARKDPIESLR